MGNEQTTKEIAPERECLPRWQEIRQQLEEELTGKENLDLTISEYLRLLEFGKNVEEESGGAAPEEPNGNV